MNTSTSAHKITYLLTKLTHIYNLSILDPIIFYSNTQFQMNSVQFINY